MNRPLLFLNNWKDPQSFHCAAPEVILCGHPGCGVSPCLTVARFLSLKQSLVGVGSGVSILQRFPMGGRIRSLSSPRRPEPSTGWPRLSRTISSRTGFSHRTYTSARLLTHTWAQTFTSLLFPPPEIPFLNFHILLGKVHSISKAQSWYLHHVSCSQKWVYPKCFHVTMWVVSHYSSNHWTIFHATEAPSFIWTYFHCSVFGLQCPRLFSCFEIP